MRQLLIFLATLFALGASPALASSKSCGEEGQKPCGGECDWEHYKFCPLCIPWCERTETYCKPGFRKFQEAGYVDHAYYTYEVCRASTQPANATVQDALDAGCRRASENTATVNDALSRSNLGTTTREKLSVFHKYDGWATTLYVTSPNTRAYRAATIPGEEDSLMAGKLISKAEHYASKLTGPALADFWRTDGPQLAPGQKDNLTLALQMLSTSSSSIPRSQFVSVALDFKIAQGFGDIIYRFDLEPQSPILGLDECKKTGEVQIQPRGGTPIRNLFRYDQRKKYWERYKSGQWYKAHKDEL